jgi:hypothetical protein
VISMSFGFDNLVPEIQEAINYASFKRVIMFAAAANHGGNAKIAYPADQKTMVLCVNSTDGMGNPSAFTPSPEPRSENYSIMGEGVKSSWPKKFKMGSVVRKAGTSFATPILVGVGATLLYYAKMRFPGSDGGDEARRVGSVEKMRAMLPEITQERRDNGYVVPGKLFNPQRSNESVYWALYDRWKSAD